MSEETALDKVLEAYRDMFGVKTERGNELHRDACIEVWKLREVSETAVTAKALLLVYGFSSVLNGSNGKGYKRCRHCGGDNLSDKDEPLPDNVKHKDGCQLAAVLAAVQMD